MTNDTLSRRAFLAATTTTAIALAGRPIRANEARVIPRKLSPNEKLNIAAIGAGGKGFHDIMSCKRENIVALCDVDWNEAAECFYKLPEARQFKDYRKMLEEMPEIDAVTISTPDHTHAPAAYTAMKMGKHVYVQKPMTHTVAEARLLRRVAKETGVATQMGNQGHSAKGAREVCEMIWSGAIGPVHAVHIWTDRPGGRWHNGVATRFPEEPVPATIDWDLWIGSAPERPYNRAYVPGKWRSFWDFGCGALGDMACHIMDPAFWALRLADAASFSIEPVTEDGTNAETGPVSATIKYSFPARGDMGPVDVIWYDGGLKPERPADIPADQKLGDDKNGSLFVGAGGYLTAGEYGGLARLLPDERMKEYKMPDPVLPRIDGGNHYRDWIDACKGGPAACSNFEYSAPFTEMVLLGNIALRRGRRIEWDGAAMRFTNDPEANELLSKSYRGGWELPV